MRPSAASGVDDGAAYEACGVHVSVHEYVAVGLSTPISKELDIGGEESTSAVGREHHIVIDPYFEAAAERIAERTINQIAEASRRAGHDGDRE